MLTGDLNVAVVPWIVQFRVKDPYQYLFKVDDVRGTLRDLAESTMRLVVGDRSINEVISKREEIAVEASLQGSGAGLANANGLLLTLSFEATGVDAGNDFTFDPIADRLVEECPTAGEDCNEIQDIVTWSGGTLTVD